MKVALCIPTYNRRLLLKEAIRSTVGFKDRIDIHVFDNCSTDGTLDDADIVGNSNITFHKGDRNVGYAGNINRILGLAHQYDWIGILHSDDLYLCDSVENLTTALRNNSTAGIVYGANAILNSSGAIITQPIPVGKVWSAGEAALSRAQHQIACSSTFYSAKAVKIAGKYSEEFSYCADEEYNARIARHFAIVEIPIVLSGYRKHDGHTMLGTWRRSDFIQQYESMHLRINSYFPSKSRSCEADVKRRVALGLLGHTSALIASGEDQITRRFYRYAFRVAPTIFLRPASFLRLIVHFTPLVGRFICRRYSKNKG
jgi:glycosyltransferase involved in cell wall biosynthesis